MLAELDELLTLTPEVSLTLAQLPFDAGIDLNAVAFPETKISLGQLNEGLNPASFEALQPEPRGKSTKILKTKLYRRKRPKDELDHLRATVANLEEELKTLSHLTETLSSENEDDSGESFAHWKQVAERQKEAANKTIVKNLKLRAMVQGQLKVARRLESAIAKHLQEVAEQAFPWNSIKTEVLSTDMKESHRPRTASISDDLLFEELNGTLEAQYAQVDTIVKSEGLADRMTELQSKFQLKQTVEGITFVGREVRLLPFPMHTVARVLWSLLLYESKHMPGKIQTRVLNNNHLNATIVDTLQLPKSHCTEIRTRIAARRFFEANRVVVVWSGCIEIAGSMFVRLCEKGFATVSSFDFLGGDSGFSPPGSIHRVVIDIKPETVEYKTGTDAQGHIGAMTDLVLGTYHRNFGLLNQVIENLLLNDLMGISGSNQECNL